MTELSEKANQESPEDGGGLEGASLPPEGEPEEELAKSNILGFILVPAMLVLMVVGVAWLFWYLTYNAYSVQDYARMLRSPNKSERWQAARELIETNVTSADLTPILIEMAHAREDGGHLVPTTEWQMSDMLKKPEEREVSLRWYATAALGQVGGPDALEALMTLIRDADKGVRFYAAQSLGRLRHAGARDELMTALKGDADSGVRMVAAWSLGEIGDPEARAPLLEAYQTDAEKDVRWNAALALARFGEESVLPTLVEMTKADNPHTRDQGRKAMRLLKQRGGK